MTRRILATALAAASLAAAGAALAAFDPVNDDTDIFLANPSFSAIRPNVLIFVDNTANWSQNSGGTTKYAAVRAALTATLTNIVTDAYNVGMAMFVETGSPNNTTDGAYIRFGIRQMTGTAGDASTNKGKLISVINALDSNNDKGNGAVYSLASAEIFKYFAGKTSYSGHGKLKADAGDRVYFSSGRQALTGSPLAGTALPNPDGSSTAQAYVSPIVDACQKNFVIFISNGEAADNSSAISTATTAYTTDIGTAPPTIALSPSGEDGIISDEYAKYMATGDCNTSSSLPGIQTVSTYTIDVLPKSTGQGPAHTALLKSMAANGKGKYYAITDISDTSQIQTALSNIFTEVQAVNSVFASTTLPVSVNVRGTNLNQVYIGVFRPDQNKSPRWLGNLKLYKLGVNTAVNPAKLFLADRTGAEAENGGTGFISANASSYWNDRNNIDFWKFRDPSLNGVGGNNELPDGDLVEKGGVAQQLRFNNLTAQTSRKIYTCTGAATGGLCASGALLSATPFNTTVVAAADVGAYATVPVDVLGSVPATSPTSTATGWTLAAHGLTAGATVRVDGAAPTSYNGDFSVVGTPSAPGSVVSVIKITQVGGIATAITSANHGYSDGDYVQILGADGSTTGYNGIVKISGAVLDTFNYSVDSSLPDATGTITVQKLGKFVYTIPVGPSADRARVVTTGAHYLNNGNTVIIDTAPNAYDTTGTSASVTSSTSFEYTAGSTLTSAHTGAVVTAKGRKTITSLTGSGNNATAVSAGHGYGTIGSTLTGVTIGGANESAFNLTPAGGITITSLDSFTYQTTSVITGTADKAVAYVTGHTFTATNPTVYIRANSQGGYNNITGGTGLPAAATTVGTGYTITRIDGNSFSFPSTVGLVGTGGAVGKRVTGLAYGSGKTADVLTVTTATAHGFTAVTPATSVRFFGSGANYTTAASCTGHDNQAFTVQSTPTTTTFTVNANSKCGTTVPTGMIVGFPIETTSVVSGCAACVGIVPVVTATTASSFYAEKPFTISSVTALSSATGTITAGNPNVVSNTVRDSIVNWVRGQDNKDNENTDCTGSPFYPCSSATSVGTTPRLTDARASIHGDVLHSRPATINYSRFPADQTQAANDNDIYAFYGSNDGMLHAIKGGLASDETGVREGDERWAFLPKEFMSKLKRLRDQSPTISNLTQKDYFFDGSIGVYQKDVTATGGRAGTILASEGDKVHLYVSLRRGGNFIYALDVTTPDAPKLLWRKGNGDLGWGEVGQTWSEPRVARLNWAFDATNNPDNVVLIFGAGYDDAVEDINPCLLDEFNATNVKQKVVPSGSTITYTSTGSCTIGPTASSSNTTVNRTKGRGILVVDAFSGKVLWQVGAAPAGASGDIGATTGVALNLTHSDMTCAIPSDITVLDRNRDGFADRLYVGDTCGQLWRAEIGATDPRDWKVTKIAQLSSGANTSMASKRKFLFPPDLVLSRDSPVDATNLYPTYFAVILGSGDREHPFDANVTNAFYMIKDRDKDSSQVGRENKTTKWVGGGTLTGSASTSTDDPIVSSGTATGMGAVFDATNVAGVNDYGWKILFAAGEKNVGTAVTIAGSTFFNTNQPSSTAGGGACGSNLGIAREYVVAYADAAATTDLNGLGSLSIANRSVIHEGGGYLPSPVPVVVEINGQKYQAVISGTSVQTPPGLTLDARLRTYWYRELDQQ